MTYAVTLARTRRYTTPLGTVSLHHVRPAFFFGYEDVGPGRGTPRHPGEGARRLPVPRARAVGALPGPPRDRVAEDLQAGRRPRDRRPHRARLPAPGRRPEARGVDGEATAAVGTRETADRHAPGRGRSIGRSEALMDEAPWFRHYEEGVPRSIPYPEITLPEALDQTVARFPDRVALRFFLDARLPVPALTYRQLQDADAALRHRALPAGRAQGRPRRPHAAELPAVRGRLLRGAADRRDPRQHEPHVRVAGDARAVRGLGLRDGGAPRPVLPAPARDPRGHAGAPGDRRGRGRDACPGTRASSSTSRSGARASA